MAKNIDLNGIEKELKAFRKGEVCKTQTINDIVKKAKIKVLISYGGNLKDNTTRKWIESHSDSYNDSCYRVQLLVYEGSPAKGYVIINYGVGFVTCFDASGKQLYTWKINRPECDPCIIPTIEELTKEPTWEEVSKIAYRGVK